MIAGALDLIAGDELALRPVMVVPFDPTPGDDRRFQPLLLIRAGIEKPGPLRRAEPFVKVAGVKIDADGAQIDGPLTDRVRAVDDREDARLARPSRHRLDGQAQRRAGGDMGEKDRPRARRDRGEDRLDHLVR